MRKEQTKVAPAISKYMSELGSKGGSVTNAKKASACRKNGFAPCRPGKSRGRPIKSKMASRRVE